MTLGAGTVLAPARQDDWGRPCLGLEGNEERIDALLSVADDQPLSPRLLETLGKASICCPAISLLGAGNRWSKTSIPISREMSMGGGAVKALGERLQDFLTRTLGPPEVL